MKKIQTIDLKDDALDFIIAKIINPNHADLYLIRAISIGFSPSKEWAVGGPLIEKHRIYISPDTSDEKGKACYAVSVEKGKENCVAYGKDTLTAAMRCIALRYYGPFVVVPEELLK